MTFMQNVISYLKVQPIALLLIPLPLTLCSPR
jgi:hypothetical protein